MPLQPLVVGRPALLIARPTTRDRLTAALEHPALAPLLVGLVTFAVFSPALFNGFVEWDDHVNTVDNPHYRGLGWTQLRWMFTTALMGHWIPLTWLTLGLDYTLWGMNPLGYHLTNVVLHAAAATVFYLVARRLLALAAGLTGRPLVLGAAIGALVFGIHPFRAESVAWVTERRDVLSGLLFLTTVLLYLRAVDESARRRRWLAASVVAYALAIMAKSMVATLPAVLLLLDVYPLRRLPWRPWAWLRPAYRPVLLEKLPYIGLALVCVAMAVWAIAVANSYLTSLERLPPLGRVTAAFYGLAFYASRTFLPLGFSALHELPPVVDLREPRFALSALGVLGVTGLLVALRRRWPGGLAAWVAYGIMVAPVSGLLHNGHQLVHDRYSYLPTLGFALVIGGGLGAVAAGRVGVAARPVFARALLAAAGLALAGLAVLAALQARVWKDTDTLWRHAIESEPTCAICYHNLGVHLIRRGLPAAALAPLERAIELRPDRLPFHGTLGLALLNSGRPAEAIDHFHTALRAHPTDPVTLSNLGGALMSLGRTREALGPLARALQHHPNHTPARINFGLALLNEGWPAPALAHLAHAAAVKPEDPYAQAGLARALMALGDADRAFAAYERLRRLDAGMAAYVATLLDAAR